MQIIIVYTIIAIIPRHCRVLTAVDEHVPATDNRHNASSPFEAVDFDVILMDNIMPKLAGPEAILKIR